MCHHRRHPPVISLETVDQILLNIKVGIKILGSLTIIGCTSFLKRECTVNYVKALACSYLSSLSLGGNAHYASERIIQVVIGILAGQIEQSQIRAMSNSKYYGSMKQFVVYGRHVTQEGKPVSTFLKLIDLVDGTATRIVETMTTYLGEKDLLLSKLMGFGSDDAVV